MEHDLSKITVIIPSYKPDEKLTSTFNGLLDAGFSDICIVDDGGGEAYSDIFASLAAQRECTLLTHDKNRGKGAAMKTAFAYLADNRPGIHGVITVDGDGQHLPCDVLACVEKMYETDSAVLGCRNFKSRDVPPRSKFGNGITSFVFFAFCGMKISDTQTGLRAFPARYLKSLAEIGGDRYEYETNMLLEAANIGMRFEEAVIHTVYLDNNSASHFDTLRDSVRIYSLILRHAAGKIIGNILGIAAFALMLSLTGQAFGKFTIAAAAVAAKLLLCVVREIINLAVLRKSSKVSPKTLALSFAELVISTLLTYAICYLIRTDITAAETLIKVAADITVFLAANSLRLKVYK